MTDRAEAGHDQLIDHDRGTTDIDVSYGSISGEIFLDPPYLIRGFHGCFAMFREVQ